MTDLQKTFDDVVNGIIGSPFVQIGWRLIVAYVVIIWLATAYWTFRDLHQRTRNPIAPYLAAGGVLALTPLAFPLALVAYRVVRPPETAAERRARELEAYVLASEVGRSACAGCGRTVDEMWMRCPACGLQLAISCRACGARVEPDWSVCAWCARDLQPAGVAAVEAPPPLPVPEILAVPDEPEREPRGAIAGWDPTVRMPGEEVAAVRGEPADAVVSEEPAGTRTAAATRRADRSTDAWREREDRRRRRAASSAEPQHTSPRR
jgi:hypothetical protein